jgi:hypothetical protein
VVVEKRVSAMAGTIEESISLTGVAEGVYTLQIIGDQESMAVRVVVIQ